MSLDLLLFWFVRSQCPCASQQPLSPSPPLKAASLGPSENPYLLLGRLNGCLHFPIAEEKLSSPSLGIK